jgi:hypothetical protein
MMTSRLLAIPMFACALGALSGCSPQAVNNPPPTPESFVKKIENNPNMTQAQKDDAIAQIRQHQGKASALGQSRQRYAGPQSK